MEIVVSSAFILKLRYLSQACRDAVAKEAREIIALVPVVLMRARTMAPSTGVDLITRNHVLEAALMG